MVEGILADAIQSLDSAKPEEIRLALNLLESALKRRFDALIKNTVDENNAFLDENTLLELERRMDGFRNTEFDQTASVIRGLCDDIRQLMRIARSMHSSSIIPEPLPSDAQSAPGQELLGMVNELNAELLAMGILDQKPQSPKKPGSYSGKPAEITKPFKDVPKAGLKLESRREDTPLTTALRTAADAALREYCETPRPSSAPAKPSSPAPPHESSPIRPSSAPRDSVPTQKTDDSSERPDVEITEVREWDLRELDVQSREALLDKPVDIAKLFRRLIKKRNARPAAQTAGSSSSGLQPLPKRKTGA